LGPDLCRRVELCRADVPVDRPYERIGERFSESSEPPAIDDAIVVGEGDQLTGCLQDAAVSRPRLAREGLQNVADGETCADPPGRIIARAVVDDEDLMRRRRQPAPALRA